MKTRKNLSALVLVLLIALCGCKNYCNEMQTWSDNIAPDTVLEKVKTSQPSYLEIDWENPETLEHGFTRYYITKIEGNRDFLNMTYFLEFEHNGYRGLFGHK